MGAILIRYAKEKEKKGEKLSNEKLGQIYDKIVNQKIKVSNENADILNSPKRKEYEKFKKDFNAYLKLRNRAREASKNKDLKRELELLEQSMQNKDKLKRKDQDVENYYRQLKKRENQLKQERELEDKRLAEFYRRSEDDKPDISSFKEKIAKIDKELLENRKEQQKHEPEYNAIQNKKRRERLTHSKDDDKGNGGNGTHPGCNQYEHKPGCPRDKD